MIKKKEMQQLNSSKNYVILFNNNNPNPPGRSLKVAANNILGEDVNTVPTIVDYYNQKFKKNKPLEDIEEQNEDIVKKNNNFLADRSVKKVEKPLMSNKEITNKPKTIQTQKIIKSTSGWKRESSSEKDINNQVKKSQGNIRIPYSPPVHVPRPQKKEPVPQK